MEYGIHLKLRSFLRLHILIILVTLFGVFPLSLFVSFIAESFSPGITRSLSDSLYFIFKPMLLEPIFFASEEAFKSEVTNLEARMRTGIADLKAANKSITNHTIASQNIPLGIHNQHTGIIALQESNMRQAYLNLRGFITQQDSAFDRGSNYLRDDSVIGRYGINVQSNPLYTGLKIRYGD